MKLISTLIVILILTGCTSMKPVELPPDQLQNRISAGEIINEGDKVRVVTVDGKKQKFEVTAITDKSIVGNDIEIPIVDIVAVETNQYSDVKSGTLMLGSFAVVIVGLLAAAAF